MSLNQLDIENVTKIYKGGIRANDGVSLRVQAGEVFGLLGHNGAGKTTLLNQIIGLARPTHGNIHVSGVDAVSRPDSARRHCSFQPQSQAPINGLTPRQAIEIMARIRGMKRKPARRRTHELLQALDITEWADQCGDKLSGGVKRLTAFCMAAVHPTSIVMFDEPTNDVDPVRRRLLWRQIRALADDGCAVMLVTHNITEAERAVDRLIILDKGREVVQGTPGQLSGAYSSKLKLEVSANDPRTASDLAKEFGATATGCRFVTMVAEADVSATIAFAQHNKELGHIAQFSVASAGLEDLYIKLAVAGTDSQKQRDTRGSSNETLVS